MKTVSAFIIIDVQEGFMNQFTKNLPLKITDFLKNHNFDFVLFFKFINSKQSNYFKVFKWDKMLQAPETNIVYQLKDFVQKNRLFTKTAFSVFRNKKFVKFLKDKNITSLYLCGLDTHACIYCSAMEAFERGFDIKVIKDLCAASHGDEFHESGIKSLERNLSNKVIATTQNIN